MKIFILLTIIFLSFSTNIFAQYSRDKALENRIECALYLLSKDKDAVETLFLPQELIKLGHYDDRVFVIELKSYDKVELFTYFGKELLESVEN